MSEFALFNFILYDFQRTLLTSGLILQCWEASGLYNFARWAVNDGLYLKYMNIGNRLNPNFESYFKEQLNNRQRPILGIFIDLNCERSELVLNIASSDHIFSENFHWVVFDRFGNLETFQKFADRINFSVSSDVTYVLSEKLSEIDTNKEFFNLYDVYNNGPMIGGKLNITIDRRIACTERECQLDRYLSLLHERSKFGNRNRQCDITLRIATVITALPSNVSVKEKMEFLNSINNTYTDPIPRFGFHQSMVLMDMLHANYNITFYDNWSLDEEYNGSFDSVLEGSSDVSSTPFAMTTYHLKYIQVLAETGFFHSTCVFRTPRKTGLAITTRKFLEPFSTPVWIIFAVILVIAAFQLWMMFFIEFARMPKTLDHVPSFLTSFLISLGTACAQGAYVLPGSIGGRTTYAILAMATMMIYNYYTSVIVAILLDSPVKSNIKTIDQVANSALEVGFEPRSWIFSYLNTSDIPAVRRLVQKKIKDRSNQYVWIDINEGLRRIRDEAGTFAYVFEGTSGFEMLEKFYKPNEICDLNEVNLRPGSSLTNQLPKNSSFRELIRLRLLRIMETGINRRMVKYWLRKRLQCEFVSTAFETVGLEATIPLFFLMFLSYMVCILVLGLEILHYHIFYEPETKNLYPHILGDCTIP